MSYPVIAFHDEDNGTFTIYSTGKVQHHTAYGRTVYVDLRTFIRDRIALGKRLAAQDARRSTMHDVNKETPK